MHTRSLWHSIIGLLACGLAFGTPARDHHDSSAAAVRTEGGIVVGNVSKEGRAFLGIPYAAPPVGDLRWRAPQPATAWHGQRDARTFAPHCPQPPTAFGTASESEDCLYLNVFTPHVTHTHGRRLPVMVWLHPGAFQFGQSDDFRPTALVGRDVIVVTLNYRLAALGFLAHPALTAESPHGASGNYGLLDQQAALRWIRRNIARFGGDPSNVTLFGQSAGGASTHVHLASPLSRGLFHRAIVQSGAYTLRQPKLAAAEDAGEAFAQAVGCPSQSLECLRALPVATLLANARPSALGYLPTVDGHVLRSTVAESFASGRFNRVPVIEGATRDEYRLFVPLFFDLATGPVTEQTYPIAISALLGVAPDAVPTIAARYPLSSYPSPGVAAATLATDRVFSCTMYEAAQLLSRHVPVWTYEFSDRTAPQIYLPPATIPYGAYHGAELQYLFDVRRSVPAPALDASQAQLSRALLTYWTQFARHGNPNGGKAPAWLRFHRHLPALQSFVAPSPRRTSASEFAARHQCAFWATQAG